MDKFAQSLITNNDMEEKNIYFEFHKEDTSCMFKKAYVTSMKNPTGGKIKEYIAGRIKSDLGVKDATINVAIKATDSDGENIKKGSGSATVTINKQKMTIPFNIIDGEVSDFSEINIAGEKIAYNKQSIGKIVNNASKPSESDAFIGTSRTDNESTDRGFLDEVIKIRDNHMSKQTNGSAGGRYITASEACDEILDKSASIKHIDQSTYDIIENTVREKVANSIEQRLEKIASIDIDKKVSHAEEVFSKMSNLPLKSVHTMKHGQIILFPEIDGNDISMTAGVVFKNINKDYYKSASRFGSVKSSYTTIVASSDGRVALLDPKQTMLALENDSVKFKLPATRLRGVEPDQIYFTVAGDSISVPYMVNHRIDCKYNHDANSIVKELSEVTGVHNPIISTKSAFSESNGWNPSVDIILIPGETFKSHISTTKKGGNSRFINKTPEVLKKVLSHRPNLLASVQSLICLEESITADPDMKVVKVKGFIKGYISDKRELNPNINRGADHTKIACDNILSIEKTASDKEEYSVKVRGRNRKDFGNKLSRNETKTIMLSMGYKPDDVGEAMSSTKHHGKYNKQLPDSVDINKLYNGEVESTTKKIVKKVKDAAFNKDKAKQAAMDFGATMTADTLGNIATENDMLYSALEYISKFANESKAAAITFEKLAMEYKSEDLQNVAKLMVASNNIFNAIKDAYSGTELSLMKEACEAITSNKDCLESIVHGISNLSRDQFLQSDEYVPYEALRTATEVIGGIYELSKHANTVNQDIVCMKCGSKSDEPLQNNKCKKCVTEELDEINSDDADRSKDDKEIKGDEVGEKDE